MSLSRGPIEVRAFWCIRNVEASLDLDVSTMCWPRSVSVRQIELVAQVESHNSSTDKELSDPGPVAEATKMDILNRPSAIARPARRLNIRCSPVTIEPISHA